jgi:murein L,D-transpeptidase YcbB/YkuD
MSLHLKTISLVTAIVLVAAGAGVSQASRVQPAASDSGLHLVLNVAGNWLYVYENGERTRTYNVSVGLPGYETPKGEYRIRDVIWNPWWHPPNSEWARGRKPTPPGADDNPMGRVKIHFAPLLYIHGTPEAESLGTPASRGCVRMRNSDVIELTHLIHQYASPRVSSELLERLEGAPTMTRTIRLQQQVRFTALYEVATIENGFLVIYPDIYGLVKKQLRDQVEHTLEQNGIDLLRVNREHLDRLVEKGGTRRVAISLDSLVMSGPRGASRDEPQR